MRQAGCPVNGRAAYPGVWRHGQRVNKLQDYIDVYSASALPVRKQMGHYRMPM